MANIIETILAGMLVLTMVFTLAVVELCAYLLPVPAPFNYLLYGIIFYWWSNTVKNDIENMP